MEYTLLKSIQENVSHLDIFYVKTQESSLEDMIKMWFDIDRRKEGWKSIL